jgi:2-polyprenyl-3-methyl-5-hydroxy-6-metoxy-1,4-benzoquinol methylase
MEPAEKRSYLLVPAGGAGEGMGHLVRCLKLSEQLGPRVSFFVRHLDTGARKLLAGALSRHKRPRPAVLARLPRGKRWDLIVVDARGTSAQEIEELMAHGLVACLDEGGDARTLVPFAVDALPGLPGRPAANLASPSFLFLPRRRRRTAPTGASPRILVSIGGEDKEGLAVKLAESLVRARLSGHGRITVVEGPLSVPGRWPHEVTVRRAPDGLARLIGENDLLITHFGMAAFEALAVGIPVVLFNPTRYHARLGAAAGFPSIGTGTPRVSKLGRLMRDSARLQAHVDEFNATVGAERGRNLSRVLRSLSRIGSATCPVCGRAGNPVIDRFADRTYRRCRVCGIVSLESFAGTRKKYDAGYFSSEYKAQYGRTYLEDFDSIKDACLPRVAILRRLLDRRAEGFVVDIGCAYGPFLAALGESGLPAFGLDVSPGAVSYVKKSLGVPALCAEFERVERKKLPRRIAALTLWYVLEHFPGVDGVLEKASALLTEGGVLAFSTPNGRGISARRNLHAFLQNSPGDHFTIFSPRKLGKILARYGFALQRVRVTGHHPERFPGIFGRAARKWAAAARAIRAISVLLRLGDTFEAYAVKGEA